MHITHFNVILSIRVSIQIANWKHIVQSRPKHITLHICTQNHLDDSMKCVAQVAEPCSDTTCNDPDPHRVRTVSTTNF